MPRYIVKLGDHYFEWSTIVDAPVTYAMTLADLETHIRVHYGELGLRNLPRRLERVARTGTSALDGTTTAELVAANRAGPDESTLSVEEIIARFSREATP